VQANASRLGQRFPGGTRESANHADELVASGARPAGRSPTFIQPQCETQSRLQHDNARDAERLEGMTN
jgi:hypothetical protein